MACSNQASDQSRDTHGETSQVGAIPANERTATLDSLSTLPSPRRLVIWAFVLVALVVAAPALRRENLLSEGGELESARAVPEFPETGVEWLGIEPLTVQDLRGRVWVFKTWTFGCINCVRSIPYTNELMRRYGEDLGVLGIHSPEFDWERDSTALAEALRQRDVLFPSLIDDGLEYFLSLEAPAWPTYFVIDRTAQIRGRWVGEMHAGTMRAKSMEALIESLIAR